MGKRTALLASIAGVALFFCAFMVSGAAAGTPKSTLVVASGALPTTIDPSVNQGRPTQDVLVPISGTLVRYKPLAPGKTTLQGPTSLEGVIAQSWVRNNNGTYTFTLRSNVKSSGGRTVTSADVKYSFDRLIANDPIGRSLINTGNIDPKDPIDVIDARHFTLRVTEPNSLALPILTYYGFGILDSTTIKEHTTSADPWAKSWLTANSAGFGPYFVAGFQPGVAVKLTANPNWWETGVPRVRIVVMRAISDDSTRMLLLRKGDVDLVTQVTLSTLAAGGKSAGVATLGARALDQNFDTIALNNRAEPYTDPRVRRAISMAINRPAIVKSVYSGLGKPALGAVSSVIPQPSIPVSSGFKYDPSAARTLLAQAGFPNGFTMKLNITPTRPGPYTESLATLLQSQLAQVGIKVEIEVSATPAEQTAAINARRLGAWLASTRPAVLDPTYLIRLAYSKRGTPSTGYSNPKIDQLADLLVVTAYGARRDRRLTSAIKILNDDMPVIPLVETVLPWAYRTNISGANPNPWGTLQPWELTKR